MNLKRTLLVGAALVTLLTGFVAAQTPQPPDPDKKAVLKAPTVLPDHTHFDAVLPLPQLLDPVCDPKTVAVQRQPLPGPTPKPSPETIKDYSQFIERTVDPENSLDLYLGIPKLLVFKVAPKRVQVADDDRNASLGLTIVSPSEISLVGKKVGRTVLNLWFADPKDATKERILSYLVRVHPDLEAADLARQQELFTKDRARKQIADSQQAYYKQMQIDLSKAFPNSFICLTVIGDTLLVTGQAHDSHEAVQILRVLQPYRAGLGGNRENTGVLITEHGLTQSRTLVIPPDVKEPEQPPAGADKQPGKEGEGKDTEASTVTRPFGLRLINQLRIPGEQQVALKVVVAEIDRTAARSIGVNFSIKNAQGTTIFSNDTGMLSSGGSGSGTSGGASTSSLANITALLNTGKIDLAIHALRSLDLARSLAEPTLVAMDGQTARFQSGGEFPVPVVTGFTASGLQGVQFVPFGVQLSFTPAVSDRDRIRLAVTADVSTRDVNASATVGGTSVPGLNTRNFQTVVELREGQTLAVAGLLQTNFGSDATRVPFFGDLPIIGRLAGFDQTSKGEQELVILVTPVLVHPLEPHELPPLPGSDVFEPSDIEFYLLGRLESKFAGDWGSPVRTDFKRMLQPRQIESQLIIGPSGHSDGR